nr:hypothetical protein [uncultured Acetatifactor sp.]
MENCMNCIVLLLLLSCCGGWGNDCGCGNRCGCGNGRDCCGRQEHRHGCHEKERPCSDGCGARDGRRERPCCEPYDDGCGRERPRCEPCDDGCGREERDCGCDAPSSGMIPPPWQDYPKFPRRDNGEDCGCEQ